MAKRSYHHGDLKKALIETSLGLLEAEGEKAITMRRLATELDVSRAAPSHHFKGKQGLMIALATEGFLRLRTAQLAAGRDLADDPFERLLAIGRCYVHFGARNPALFRIMFRGEYVRCEAPELRKASTASYEVLREATRAVCASEGEARALALASWSIVHGLVTLWLDGPLGKGNRSNSDDALDAMVDQVFLFFSDWVRTSSGG